MTLFVYPDGTYITFELKGIKQNTKANIRITLEEENHGNPECKEKVS